MQFSPSLLYTFPVSAINTARQRFLTRSSGKIFRNRNSHNHPISVTKLNLGPLTWCSAKPTYWHLVVVKKSTAFITGTKQGECAACAQNTELPRGFQGRIFKQNVKERVTGYMISWCTILWFVDGEVTGWCYRNLNYQPSGSNQPEVYLLVVRMQLTSSTWWGF